MDDPPLGRLYQVGSRKLALHLMGERGPAVVFLPGAGLIGLDFLNVQKAVSAFTRAASYDRGGTGWSDSAPLPRSAADAAEELRALLDAAEIAPPYVLVGHSLGGAYARRFAQLYPDETAGLVLLDPAHEGYAALPNPPLWAQMVKAPALAPVLVNLKGFYRKMFVRLLADWPDGLRERLIDYHLAHLGKTLAETRNLKTEILSEIARGGSLPDVPLVVLTAVAVDPFQAVFLPRTYLEDTNRLKRSMYDAFAASAPRGENRPVDAGHSALHTDRPDAVVAAIRDVVDAIAFAVSPRAGGSPSDGS